MTKLINRFINFKTKAAYDTFVADASNSISDESIVFITDTNNRDIITHGVSMVGGVPRISSYSVNGGTRYGSVSGGANLNFSSGDGIDLQCNEKGITISTDLPIRKGTAESSVKINSESNSANGVASIAAGVGTMTAHEAESACGKYNVSHDNTDKFTEDHDSGQIGTAHTVYSIGGGSSDENRKNLFEVMDNGDIYIMFKGKYRRLQTLLDDEFTISDNTFTIISDGK